MKLPNYLYLFTKLSLFIIIAFTFFVFWNIDKVLAINNCNDGWQIAVGQTKQINCHGICKKVTNNCSKTIFVPTKTSSEWSEFRINRPSCVSLTSCCTVGAICNYGSWQCDGYCRRKRVLYKYDSNCNCVASGQYEYQNCSSGTTCSGGSCRSDVACSTGGYACKDQCTRGQRQYRCDGSNNCNQFWRWINTSSCNPFRCSGGSCSNVCESSCGASSQCDEKSPNSIWTSGNTCYWCNSSCSYGYSSSKPSSYYLSGDTCYYNCSITCQVGGWNRSSCSSQSCPPTRVSGNYCYYNRSCTSSGCTYNSYDTNKQCDTSVCTTSGWDNSSCAPSYKKVCNNAMGFSCQSWCQINFNKNCAFIAGSWYATGPNDTWSWRLWFYDFGWGCCNVTYSDKSKYNCNTVIDEQCPTCYCTCGAACHGAAYSTVCYCQ